MRRVQEFSHIPIVDVRELVAGGPGKNSVADELGRACRESGFFYVVGHGVDAGIAGTPAGGQPAFLRPGCRDQDARAHGSGRPGLAGLLPRWRRAYLGKAGPEGRSLFRCGAGSADHPQVKAGVPLHGPNLFPAEVPELRAAVLEYVAALTRLGHRLMAGLALALGLDESYFEKNVTGDPLTLFRIFSYPPPRDESLWGVGEHTDYGLLTILLQDDAGGLEVRSRSRWVAAPPVPGSFVCNIGDMLDRMTRGVFRSTPHRVRNPAAAAPFVAVFFDPGFFTRVQPIDLPADQIPEDDSATRWDGASVHTFQGTYGDYLLNKVGKVFPELQQTVL